MLCSQSTSRNWPSDTTCIKAQCCLAWAKFWTENWNSGENCHQPKLWFSGAFPTIFSTMTLNMHCKGSYRKKTLCYLLCMWTNTLQATLFTLDHDKLIQEAQLACCSLMEQWMTEWIHSFTTDTRLYHSLDVSTEKAMFSVQVVLFYLFVSNSAQKVLNKDFRKIFMEGGEWAMTIHMAGHMHNIFHDISWTTMYACQCQYK